MEAFNSKGITNRLKRYYVSHRMHWRCKFQFRYVTDKTLFTLPVYFTREQNCQALFLKQVWRSEGKWNPCKLKAKKVLKHARITSLVGKLPPYIAVNKYVAAFTFAAWQISSHILLRLKHRFLVDLQFCVDFWRNHAIEMNSLAVWSKWDKKFKGKLVICCGKQELARTCSVNINAEDNHSNLLPCDWRDCYLLLCLSFTHSTNKLNFGFCNVGKKAVYWKQYYSVILVYFRINFPLPICGSCWRWRNKSLQSRGFEETFCQALLRRVFVIWGFRWPRRKKYLKKAIFRRFKRI